MKNNGYFKLTSWSVDNKIPVYMFTFAIIILGIIAYINLPKEQFPDIVIPTIIVQTVYPGTSPADVENLITKPIEKQLKAVTGIKRVRSQSLPDVSVVIVEFTTDVEPSVAKQRVSDAVDKSKNFLPDDLDRDPVIQEVDFSEFPIMFVNISGKIESRTLKNYAEDIQDAIESLKEITRVDIIGAPEREFQVDLDLFKMQAATITFNDVQNAIRSENINISAGEILNNGTRRNIRILSQFKDVEDIKNIIIKSGRGSILYLRDIATVRDDLKEQQSFARLNGEPVITLSVIKRSGQNLIDAAEKIYKIVDDFTQTKLPKGVRITITGDRSIPTRVNLDDLINSVIIGFILVVLVLMFFMGVRDSVFVGLAVPISSFLAFLLMPSLGFSFNLVVTFTFLLALGIIVDDAIVVVENTHRLYTKEGMEIRKATKSAATEVIKPVIAGTLTTIAPFFPLLFFPGIAGKFMFYLPVIMILTLVASLFVAFVINPVLAADFMHKDPNKKINPKRVHIVSAVMIVFAILFHLISLPIAGNMMIILVILGYFNQYILTPVLIKGFQEKVLPLFMKLYKGTLRFFLKGKMPYFAVAGMFLIFIISIVIFAMFPPKVVFFPQSEPNFVYVYIKLPIGTDAKVTDSVTKIIEGKVENIIGKNNPLVKSIISNVGIGAGDPSNPDRTITPHKGKITVAFVEFAKRGGKSTQFYLDEIRNKIKNFPGAEILVSMENSGPPVGKPINIEISGDDIKTLQSLERQLKQAIKNAKIEGIEKLNSDLVENKPEILIEIDRIKANSEGISSAQVGLALRTAIFGTEATKFRDDKDEYPVQIRIDKDYRNNLDAVLNMPITFRDMNTNQFRQVPISAFTKISYINTFESINRKNQKRTITLSSNVIGGFNANQINREIAALVSNLNVPLGYSIKLTGEQEDQKEASGFLSLAFLISIILILLILVTQFNSTIKPLIILTQIILSTIGVFLGFAIFKQTFSIVVTGIGVVALAGIVVKNGIILIDFIEELRKKGGRIRENIVNAGAIRFNPVALTAASTSLGLIPLAIGFNINFETFLSAFNPNIFLGGDSVAFWAPLAWAIIYGLTFSTFLTLVVVPCMYFIQYTFNVRFTRWKRLRRYRLGLKYNNKINGK